MRKHRLLTQQYSANKSHIIYLYMKDSRIGSLYFYSTTLSLIGRVFLLFVQQPINNTVMTISIKEDNLTVAIELEENDFDKSVSCEEAMIAAFDVLSRIFPEESVTRAYYRIDPDSLVIRKEDDPVRMMYERIYGKGEV